MQWDHLRTFEAVARLGSMSAAAGALKISLSSVSRHIARLEAQAGEPLLAPAGLTARGEALRDAVEPMLRAALAARSALEADEALRGVVTIASVGELVRWQLVRHIPLFLGEHPALQLNLLAGNHVVDLATGEADIALRMARPERGELIARKIGVVSYGLFMSAALEQSAQTPWLGLTGSLAQIPEQRCAARLFADRPPRLLVEDVEALGGLVEAGLGAALLPRGLASRLRGLVEPDPAALGAQSALELPDRALWMVVHPARQHIPRVRAVMDWLIEVCAPLHRSGAQTPEERPQSLPPI